MQGLTNSHKQRICAAFASVIRFSGAKEHINADRFFLELSRDIEQLLHNGILDLNPLYVSYGGRTPAPEVCGAFMLFESVGSDLGIKLRMPEGLTHIPLQIRNQYREDFLATYKPEEVQAPADNIEWLKLPQTPLPISDHVHHLELDKRHPRAFSISEATRTAIADAATWALKDTAAGNKLNGAQITFLLREHFDRFCDGHHLDLNPLLNLWRKQCGIDKRDLREGLQRLKHYLGEINIGLDDPLMGLDPSARRIILATIDAKPDLHTLFPPPSDARQRSGSNRPERKSDIAQATTPEEIIDEETLRELAEYGLDGKAKEKKIPLVAWLIPIALIMSLAIFLTRPIRYLDVGPYNQVLPLKSVQLAGGIFYGVIDKGPWEKLTNLQRKAAAASLSIILDREDRLKDALIARPDGRIIIFYLEGHQLRVSKEALKSK
jgi:hypothetical protein